MDEEAAALTNRTLDPNTPTMQQHETPRDIEAELRSLDSGDGSVDTGKLVEHLWNVLFRNPTAGVRNLEQDATIGSGFAPNCDNPSLPGKFYGIADQVPQYLFDLIGIREDDRKRFLNPGRDLYVFRLSYGTRVVGDRLYKNGGGNRLGQQR